MRSRQRWPSCSPRSGPPGSPPCPTCPGLGHDGYHQGRLLFNDRNGLALLMVVLPPDRVADLLDGLRALLASRPGVLMVSDTYVSRPEYFQ